MNEPYHAPFCPSCNRFMKPVRNGVLVVTTWLTTQADQEWMPNCEAYGDRYACPVCHKDVVVAFGKLQMSEDIGASALAGTREECTNTFGALLVERKKFLIQLKEESRREVGQRFEVYIEDSESKTDG